MFQILEFQDRTKKNKHQIFYRTCDWRIFSKPRTFNIFDSVNPYSNFH
jgi:hypothetical protein